jgi:glycosyltransferase involved in cell wall biosynthesis/tetratricopeptide (TPR) repeat protein
MATIGLGMIVRDEGRTLEEALKSIAPHVDQIVIGLGGKSQDDTEEIARKFTSEVFEIDWQNDFSAARQEVLNRVTTDYFLWMDGDDIIVNGESLRNLPVDFPGTDAFYFGYNYAQDEMGQSICWLVRERLLKNPRAWEWKGRVHEVLVPADGVPKVNQLVNDILWVHHKPPGKTEPDRNLRLLYEELEAGEPNPDPRVLAYLGSENALRGNLREALVHWQRFIPLCGWDEEKYQILHKMADAWRIMGDYKKSLDYDRQATELFPREPDAWFGMAETYYRMKNYLACIEYTKIGSSKPRTETMLITNPLDYTFHPAMVLGLAYTALQDFEMAYAQFREAWKVREDPRLATQIKLIEEELELQQVVRAFLKLREHLGRNDEWLKVRQLVANCVPKHLQHSPPIVDAYQRTMVQTAHIDDPQIMVDFYTGNPHWAPMDEERILDENQLKYPRLKFAIDVAKRINAQEIVDWGCSDGFISLPLARETGARVHGLDLDPRCVDLANLRAKKWGLDAYFEVGNVDQVGTWQGPKADLAIFFEVIEHLVDPVAGLAELEKTANHIAITTPFMSWDRGRVPWWDKLEPKGHLRIFDQMDLEAMISPRGQIWNLYRQPMADTGWILADYRPGARTDKNIICLAPGTLEKWNPRMWAEGGLGGSETAIIKLAEAFANAGHRMISYIETDDPGYYYGGAYRPVDQFHPEVHSDLFIAWRLPEAADLPINTDRLVLWMHDTDAGDRLTPVRARKFDSIVVLTEWHKNFMLEKYPFLDPNKLVVIGNGVDLGRFPGWNFDDKDRNPHRVIYSSSPDRGLDIILEGIWPQVVEAIPDAELHIYYGWNNFDKVLEAGYEHLRPFREKVNNLLLNAKNVVNHGRINQEELAKEFAKSSVWLYPTYFPETYCITAIEAQLAGVVPITNHFAALAETVQSGVFIDNNPHDPAVQQAFAEQTIRLLKLGRDTEMLKMRRLSRKNAPAVSWDQRAVQWLDLLKEK